jgi:hypothetical protein
MARDIRNPIGDSVMRSSTKSMLISISDLSIQISMDVDELKTIYLFIGLGLAR